MNYDAYFWTFKYRQHILNTQIILLYVGDNETEYRVVGEQVYIIVVDVVHVIGGVQECVLCFNSGLAYFMKVHNV